MARQRVAGICRGPRRCRSPEPRRRGYTWTPEQQQFLAAVVKDLKANAGECAVIPGEQQPMEVHLAAIAINEALGNVGKTVIYTETVNPLPSQSDRRSEVAGRRHERRQGRLAAGSRGESGLLARPPI